MGFDSTVRTSAPRSGTAVAVRGRAESATATTRTLPQAAFSRDFSQVRVHSERGVVRRACGPAAIGTATGCASRTGDVGGPSFLFDVACDELAPGEEARLRAFARTVATGERVTVDGFASEEGNLGFNRDLSCARADKAVAILTAEGVTPAQITGRYMHGATAGPRPARRSVVITKTAAPGPVPPTPTPTPTPPTPTPAPTPAPPPVPNTDCSKDQGDQLARARPIAVSMVAKALRMLGLSSAAPETAQVKALLRKYFGDDGGSTYLHVMSGFRDIQGGLRAGVTYECESPGSLMFNHFCDNASAYVRHPLVARNVHVCPSAFGHSDETLARILVHENSHLYGWTDDEQYCSPLSGCTLDRWDAYDNADSYARFAEELHRTFP